MKCRREKYGSFSGMEKWTSGERPTTNVSCWAKVKVRPLWGPAMTVRVRRKGEEQTFRESESSRGRRAAVMTVSSCVGEPAWRSHSAGGDEIVIVGRGGGAHNQKFTP